MPILPFRFASARSASIGAAFVWCLGALVPTVAQPPEDRAGIARATPQELELLTREGIAVTVGAAPDYVPDGECARCHSRIARTYRQLGMSRSFDRPGGNGWLEDFDAGPFFHAPSRRYYQMRRQGQELLFVRYQEDREGREINRIELEVDWVLGSGSVARSYLYSTPEGALYELPLGWYSQEKRWKMSPGFESADHLGVRRVVRRGCLACHNAFPEVPAGSDSSWRRPVFPRELPRGIGCQRCHGPGARHVSAVLAGESAETVSDRIVNPARLEASRRRDVCLQCHDQPAVAVTSPNRLGVGDLGYRPGTALDDHRLRVDVEERGRTSLDRFEINHHGHRLEKSRCFIESDGAFDCLSCHDPHAKPARPSRLAKAREVCLGCHPSIAQGTTTQEHGTVDGRRDHRPEAECVSCHMPRRRAEDVVHAIMTDHLIQRGPPSPEWLEPREKTTTVPHRVVATSVQEDAVLTEMYLAAALLRTGSTEPEPLLDRLLQRRPLWDAGGEAFHFDLAGYYLRRRQWNEAHGLLQQLHLKRPDDPRAAEWLSLAQGRVGQLDRGIETLRRVLERHPERSEARFNLALFLRARGDTDSAMAHLDQALALSPNLVQAWRHRGQILAQRGAHDLAVASFRQALALEPRDSGAYAGIVGSLAATEQLDEARRYLVHGLETATRRERLQALAAELGLP